MAPSGLWKLELRWDLDVFFDGVLQKRKQVIASSMNLEIILLGAFSKRLCYSQTLLNSCGR